MDPDHSSFTPPRLRQPQRITPQLPLFLLQPPHLPRLLFLPAFLIFILPRRPSLFPSFVHELRGMLLEHYESEKGEFVIGGYLGGGARNDHWRHGFVGFVEVFDGGVGDGDQEGVEVFGVLDYLRRFHY